MNDCDRNFKPSCPPVGPNIQQPVLFNRTTIDPARGDETGPEAPYKGKYHNTLVVYEASDAIYLFSSDGNFTFLGYGFSQITKEEVERLISEAIGEEAALREEADQELQDNIDEVSLALGNEVSARESADTALDSRIDTVSADLEDEISARESADSGLSARISTVESGLSSETTARENADTALQSQITATDNAINKTVMTDLVVDPNTSTSMLELDATKTNIKTSSTITTSIPLPVANSTQAGVMNSATFDAVTANTSNINALINGAVAVTGISSNPTQSELTTAWQTATGLSTLMNRAGIYDVTNQKVWTYYVNDTTWHAASNTTQVTINPFTNSSAGTIMGSTNIGQVFAENDGTGSVNGWDALSGQVATNTSKLATIEQGAQVNPTIDTTLSTSSNNPIANSAVTTKIDDAAYIDSTIGQPSSLAYVGSANIQDGAVTTDKIANLNVTEGKLASNSVTTAKIADGAVTAAKLGSDVAAVAITGSYNDLSNTPTIPTVNNATLTIQKNGSNVATFTANASSNVTANISVPTITLSTTDIGEGATLAANTLYGVYS